MGSRYETNQNMSAPQETSMAPTAHPLSVRIACECGYYSTTRVTPGESVARTLSCEHCGAELSLGGLEGEKRALDESGGLWACCACGHPELFTRRDLPQKIGVTVVVIAAIFAPFTNYLSLVLAGLIDFVLYFGMPSVTTCYVCVTEHRGYGAEPKHPRYDPEIADRVRFGDKAVMGAPMREGGTANAPEPHH